MRHAQNAPGPFWIDQDVCVACAVCYAEAGDNIRFDDHVARSYVYKQPEGDNEMAAVREAVDMCPVEAVKEDGW